MDKDNNQKPKQPTLSSHKGNIQKWDSYNDIASTLTMPTLEESAAVIVIDESVRRKLGKLHILELIQNIAGPEMNCYVDIIPSGTSDNDVIKVFNSYADFPAVILTSDKNLHRELLGRSLFVKAKKGNDAVRIITKAIKHRILRL
ncbi:MAG TPA: hypothetical protein VI278_06530 [Nitrososphaeraceae archaeon]